jgi:hypothetical protein
MQLEYIIYLCDRARDNWQRRRQKKKNKEKKIT